LKIPATFLIVILFMGLTGCGEDETKLQEMVEIIGDENMEQKKLFAGDVVKEFLEHQIQVIVPSSEPKKQMEQFRNMVLQPVIQADGNSIYLRCAVRNRSKEKAHELLKVCLDLIHKKIKS